MRNYIIDWEKYETTFEEENIIVMLKRLNRDAFLMIAPELAKTQQIENKNEEETDKNSDSVNIFMKGLEIQGAAEKILETHMIWKDGFLINGKEPSIKMLCNYSQFSTLVMDIMGELIRMSTVSRADVKN